MLFETVNAMFVPKKWNDVKKNEKSKNFFMINRFMAIKYPYQANLFNHMKVDAVSVIDFWQITMSKLHTKVPGWMYTKTKKTEAQKKGIVWYPSEETLKFYCERHKCSKRQIEETIKFFPKFLDELKNLETQMKA